MVKRLVTRNLMCAVFGLSAMMASPAHATGSIDCSATDGSGAEFLIGVGRLPVIAIISAMVSDGTQEWSLDGSFGTQISVGQAFMDEDQVLVDFVDTNIEEILISIRLYRAWTDESYAEAGIMTIKDGGVFPMKCEEG